MISSGANPVAQSKASYILNYLMSFWLENDYLMNENGISKNNVGLRINSSNSFIIKVVMLYLKSSCTDSELTKCIILVLQNFGVKYFIECIQDLINKQKDVSI